MYQAFPIFFGWVLVVCYQWHLSVVWNSVPSDHFESNVIVFQKDKQQRQ